MPSKRGTPQDGSHWSESLAKSRRDNFRLYATDETEVNDDESEEQMANGVELGKIQTDPDAELPPPSFVEDSTGIKYTITLAGTHVHVCMVYKLERLEGPVPVTSGRKVVPKLPLLERYGRNRPRTTDGTLRRYIERVAPDDRWLSIAQGFVPNTSRTIYHYRNEFVAVDYERKASCAKCGKAMLGLNNRTARMIDNFRFRACCYPQPVFRKLSPAATVDIDEVVPIFYDIETTPNDENHHEVYMGVMTVPSLVREGCGGEEFIRFDSPDEFMAQLDRVIRTVNDANHDCKNISIQLVSFNGSKYDDLFLVKAWRKYIYQSHGKRKLDEVEYSERKGAITFNTLKLSASVEVRWTDLFRFVPPTSLRKLAKAFKLSEEKGSMPFEALNDYVRGRLVKREDDGFLCTDTYYKGDRSERQRSLEYYKQVVPIDKRNATQDLEVMCFEYCKQDVKVTQAAYNLLDSLYTKYLKEQATISPHSSGSFRPMCLHSLATMAGRILLASAAGSTVWGWDSDTQRESQVTAELPGWEIMAPRDSTYDYARQAIVGGWVRGYFQGLVLDPKALPEEEKEEIVANVNKMKVRYDVKTLDNMPHDMTDIASMYPVAVTYPMPVGLGHWVELAEDRAALIEQCINEPDPLKIPKFFCRAKWRAPRRPAFYESTLPQRRQASNSLQWTYWDDLSADRVVTSLDLWISCRNHLDVEESNWKVYGCTDMLYFPKSSQLYRPFMAACTKLKTDGAAAGNEEQRTIGKIAMNSGIGKLGQGVEARHNVLGADRAKDFSERLSDKARLVTVEPVDIPGSGHKPPLLEEEYIFGVKDSSHNGWPTHHAAFMYSATRLMRLHWSLLTRPAERREIPIFQALPDTLYGDTDSKLLPTSHSKLAPPEFMGSDVGQFQPENPPSLMTRPYFQVEPEKISLAPTCAAISGILAPKKYFVWGYNPENKKSCLKFKCNGLTRFAEDRHSCPLHKTFRCERCQCPHDIYVFECLPCSIRLLANEELVKDEEGVMYASSPGYKYSLQTLTSLTLLDFLRVLVTGIPLKVVSDRFVRTLSQHTSKLPQFTIETKSQGRTLSRPKLLSNLTEIVKDKPQGRLQPYMTGCAHASDNGVLWPSGTYLLEADYLLRKE